MDTYSTFEWTPDGSRSRPGWGDFATQSTWSIFPTPYDADPQLQRHHAFQQSVQGLNIQEFPIAFNKGIDTSDGGIDDDGESIDGASICSDQCSQVSCIDCCSETACQPDCLTPCENPDTCEVPDSCALTACADRTCLVELPICPNDTCHSPLTVPNWQAWQDSFLMGSQESYDHNMLSIPGGLEVYPLTILDCYRIIQGLHLHVYGFCSQPTIYQAVINHIRTYHGHRIAHYLSAHPDLLPHPYICSTGADQGCPGDFANGPTAPALSILSFSMGSEQNPPTAFTSELRRKDSNSPPTSGFNVRGLGSMPVDIAPSGTKRRKITHPTDDDHYNRGEALSTNRGPSMPCSDENDVTQRNRNFPDPGHNLSIPTYHILGHNTLDANQQRTPEMHTDELEVHEQNENGQDDPKHSSISQETQERNAPEQHACMWVLNHTSGATCGTTFESARLLQDHVDKVHVNNLTAAGGLKCEWQHCQRDSKPFEQKLKLLRHVFSHTKDKRFFCKSCGKGFTTETLLEQHTRVHTGEKPYPCKTCGKRFAYSTALSSHLRVHTREKPLICGVDGCQKAFSESSNLTKHRKSHNSVGEYICEICKKDFNRKDGLRRHMKIHDKKPFTIPPNSKKSGTTLSSPETNARRSLSLVP